MSAATLNPAIPPVPTRPFTVEQWHRMIEAGVFDEDDRLELLEGWIVPKMVHNPRHDASVDCTREAVEKRLPPGWRVRVQSAVTTSDSEPEPDVAIVRGPATRYHDRHPGPSDMPLAVEVADSSVGRDRGLKLRIYARAAIPTYWIVNLIDRVVEVHTDPTGPGPMPTYRETQVVKVDESLSLSIEGQAITVPASELFSG